MEWFFFLFMGAMFFISLYWVREKYTIARLFLFTVESLLFGLLLSTGISFPNGTTSVVSGATTTQTVNYIVYTATLTGTNSFPVLFGLSWILIVLGILGLIYSLVEVFRYIFTPNEKQIQLL